MTRAEAERITEGIIGGNGHRWPLLRRLIVAALLAAVVAERERCKAIIDRHLACYPLDRIQTEIDTDG